MVPPLLAAALSASPFAACAAATDEESEGRSLRPEAVLDDLCEPGAALNGKRVCPLIKLCRVMAECV